MFGLGRKTQMPEANEVLAGRVNPMQVPAAHFVNGNPLEGPFAEHLRMAMFGMGCFWGAERRFWQLEGVHSTAVGYTAGFTPNPSYEEVCSGMTGHNEVVRVVFDPQRVSYQQLLRAFWKDHNPTQGMRQGNDVGTQYRSGIYTFSEFQQQQAQQSRGVYQHALQQVSAAPITTEILAAPVFYFAEAYHQQYLAKNPNGYCGLGGTGVSYP